MATYLLVIMASIEANSVLISSLKAITPTIAIFLSLKYMLFIYYLVWFKEAQVKAQTIINSDSKVNTII